MRELHQAMAGTTQGAPSEPDKVEIWFHEDCVSWMSDIRIVGHVIIGKIKAEKILCSLVHQILLMYLHFIPLDVQQLLINAIGFLMDPI